MMEEEYINEKIVVRLTKDEILKMLAGSFISGYKIKQIGMKLE